MENTNYSNPHGLSAKNNFSNALDLAVLSNYALSVPQFKEIVNSKEHSANIYSLRLEEHKSICWKNTNKLLAKGFDGIKTGVTDSAGPCLAASIEQGGTRLTMVLLNCSSMS